MSFYKKHKWSLTVIVIFFISFSLFVVITSVKSVINKIPDKQSATGEVNSNKILTLVKAINNDDLRPKHNIYITYNKGIEYFEYTKKFNNSMSVIMFGVRLEDDGKYEISITKSVFYQANNSILSEPVKQFFIDSAQGTVKFANLGEKKLWIREENLDLDKEKIDKEAGKLLQEIEEDLIGILIA